MEIGQKLVVTGTIQQGPYTLEAGAIVEAAAIDASKVRFYVTDKIFYTLLLTTLELRKRVKPL